LSVTYAAPRALVRIVGTAVSEWVASEMTAGG